MIISCVNDEALRRAVRLVASPDEDVFRTRPGTSGLARRGYPRLIVFENTRPMFETLRLVHGSESGVPVLNVTAGTLARWRFERRLSGRGRDLESEFAFRLRGLVDMAPRTPWVEGLFRSLERAAGVSLPAAFRGFARRVLEHPGYYCTLAVVSERLGLTAGAIQGRFLRRGLRSPSEHLRWLRLLAVSEALGDPALTLGAAADRFGYTSAGNLCRSLQNTCGKAPSALRDPITRIELQARFAQSYLGNDKCLGWDDLEDLFWGIPPLDTVSAGLTA